MNRLQQGLESPASAAQQSQGALDTSHGAREPRVLFIDDLAERLSMSVRTIQRRLRFGAFPIPTLPSLDHRHRWSSAVVDAWLSNPGAFDHASLQVRGRGNAAGRVVSMKSRRHGKSVNRRASKVIGNVGAKVPAKVEA